MSLEHGSELLDLLKVAGLPVEAILVVMLYFLWREYRALRQQFTDYLIARRLNGDDSARIALEIEDERRNRAK